MRRRTSANPRSREVRKGSQPKRTDLAAQELPHQRRCRTAAVPSLAVLRQSAISGRANRSPEVKIGPFAGQKPAFESRFCGAFKPAPGRLETHAKNPIYSIAC